MIVIEYPLRCGLHTANEALLRAKCNTELSNEQFYLIAANIATARIVNKNTFVSDSIIESFLFDMNQLIMDLFLHKIQESSSLLK